MSSPNFAFEQPAQSALQAQGEAAAPILELTWVLLVGGSVIFVTVMAAALVALAGPQRWRPGKTNRLRLHAAAPGVFRGQCAEFCGMQHAKMALLVVAQAPADCAAWLQARRQPATAPAQPMALRGQALFAEARCGVCHTVRGTAADGKPGPDLTHVGSRLTLAAGTLPNGIGPLAGWIADPQHVKPGSLMPAYRRYSGEELRALASYLEGLR